MKNNKWNAFWNRDIVKPISVFVLALVLIMVSIVLFEDIKLDNSILIMNIFGTLSLIGFLYSYALTKKNMYKDLSLGYTRKEIFVKYMKNILLVLGIAIVLVGYYILIYILVINHESRILSLFDFRLITLLPLIFLSLSFLGFLLGLLKLKRRFFYSLATVLCSGIAVLLIFYSTAYLFNGLLLMFVVLLGFADYLLMINYKI